MRRHLTAIQSCWMLRLAFAVAIGTVVGCAGALLCYAVVNQ